MAFAPTYHRTRRGRWVVIAPDGDHAIGDQLDVTRRDHTRVTITIAGVSAPFTHRNQRAVYLTPARTRPDTAGTCDACGATAEDLFRTADARNVAGRICRPCEAVPVDMLVFASYPTARAPQLR